MKFNWDYFLLSLISIAAWEVLRYIGHTWRIVRRDDSEARR